MSREGKEDGPARVGKILQDLLRKWGIEGEVERQEVLEGWADAVGGRIAAVTRATAVSRGVLFVEVRSSAWMTELNLMRHQLLDRLNAGRGEAPVERIVFTLAESPGRGRPGPEVRGRRGEGGGGEGSPSG
jgi:predicted nucleic acid-binding Zn ribbon protein